MLLILWIDCQDSRIEEGSNESYVKWHDPSVKNIIINDEIYAAYNILHGHKKIPLTLIYMISSVLPIEKWPVLSHHIQKMCKMDDMNVPCVSPN